MSAVQEDDHLPSFPRLLDDGEMGIEVADELDVADDAPTSLDDQLSTHSDTAFTGLQATDENGDSWMDDSVSDIEGHEEESTGPEYGWSDDAMIEGSDFDADFAPELDAGERRQLDLGDDGLDDLLSLPGLDDAGSHLPPLADGSDGEGPAESAFEGETTDDFDPKKRPL
jgi:hypothetical protein